MRKLVLICLVTGVGTFGAKAQSLFTYGSHSVSKEEFLRVYKKNSINKAPDMSDTALRSYLNLYSLFRMKVAEAEKEKLDTLSNIQKELDSYRKTLAKTYLTDEHVTNKLIHEAYDRMKMDVRVEHILVSCTPGSDTVAPYRKIDSIYNEIVTKKASFEDIAKATSDDKGSKDNGGDLGYFSGMQTVYAFENEAFNTPVGKISKPFRTQFGFHILKVMDRHADPGQVKVAQIMIASPKSRGEGASEAAHKRADSVVAKLKAGAKFEDLVKEYSDDHYSNKEGGVMKPFGVGRMAPAFEKAAFALKTPGELSEPIHTEYGWHVIKLIQKISIEPYDSMYTQLKHKVENDSRAQSARDLFFANIKSKNGYREFPDAVREISDKIASIPDTGKDAKLVKAANYMGMNKVVFTMAGKNYLQSDFAKFFEGLTHGKINGPHGPVIHDGFNMYVSNVVNDFEEHKLVEENTEFRNLMEEYRDGIMLFELMDRNVWGKASHDSEGLKAFFETRKSKYMWEPGFEGSVYKFKGKAAFDTGMSMWWNKTNTDEMIVRKLNTSNNPDGATVQKGRFEFNHFKEATLAELEQNNMKTIYPSAGSNNYTVVIAKTIHKDVEPKTLDDARGYVVAEYQDFLEKQWNEKMKAQFPMKVNETVFATMSKEKGGKAEGDKKKKSAEKK
jgi:peptidyl-prolyl cis-trans isomerase SurA